MQIHAEKSPYLVEKLKIWMLPTLALIRHEKTVDYVVGFDDMGGKDDFTTEVLSSESHRDRLGDVQVWEKRMNEVFFTSCHRCMALHSMR